MPQLLQNAAYGTIMILMVIVLRRVLRDQLAPGARLALWAVCLLRLLTPVPLESALSLWGLVGRFDPAEAGTQTVPTPAGTVTGPVYALEPGAPTAPAASANPVAPVDPAPAAFPWGEVLTAVWVLAGAALAVWYAVCWIRARRAVSCAIPVGEDDPRRRFLPRFAQLREGPMEGAPLTFGVVRPQVVLSPGLGAEELVCVLAHEGVHARRRDNLWHYAMALALIVHWWNPAVWVMSRLLRRDIELACDRAALKKLGEDRRAEYAQALVTLSTQGEGNGPAFCQTFGRKATEERIRSIMKFKKPTIIGVVLTLVLVLGVSIAFASDPKTPEEDNGSTGPADMAADYDGSGEYGSEFRCSVYYDGTVVTRVVIPLSVLEEDLDIRVDEKSMSSAEAELILTQAQHIAADGVIDWTFTEDNGLRHEELPEESDEDTTVSANGYWDKDGKFVKVSFSEIVRDFILPQALMGEDSGTLYGLDGLDGYKVVLPEIDEDGNSLVYDEDGNLVIVGIRTAGMDGEKLCEDESCDAFPGELHYHDENGVAQRVSVHYQVPGLLCTQLGCTESGSHEHNGILYEACAATCTPEQYAAALDCWVELGAVSQSDAEWWMEMFQGGYDRVQKGESDAFNYNIYDGIRTAAAFYVSDRAAAGYPVNSKGETYGPGGMSEVYGGVPDLILAQGTKGETGYVRNGEGGCLGYPGGVNNPEEAMAYMEWCKTQPETVYIPLYDCEGNEIGKFAMHNSEGQPGTVGYLEDAAQNVSAAQSVRAAAQSILSSNESQSVDVKVEVEVNPTCPIDGCNEVTAHQHNGVWYCFIHPVCTLNGCTFTGEHFHDGVVYSCNGAGHLGPTGSCDGSCTDATTAAGTSTPVHHSESHHSNHH